MNDYVRGALEALMWARVVLEDLKGEEGGLERGLQEIDKALDDVNQGVAVDFRRRLKYR